MRLDNEKPDYDSIEDRRGQGGKPGGGFGIPGGGGRRINIPMGGRGGRFSISTIVMLVIAYFVMKLVFGIDLLQVINGGGVNVPGGGTNTEITVPDGSTDIGSGGDTTIGTGTADAGSDAGKEFVARIMGSNNRIWNEIFTSMGKTYEKPKLVLFEDYVQGANRSEGGFGLGLSSARRAARLMDARVGHEPRWTSGAQFWLEFDGG